MRSIGVDDRRTGWAPLFEGKAKFASFTHQDWVAWVRAHDTAGKWADWLSYVASRYGLSRVVQTDGGFTESTVEEVALAWLEGIGYLALYGLDIAPGEARAERDDHGQVVLERWPRQALERLNPAVASEALEAIDGGVKCW